MNDAGMASDIGTKFKEGFVEADGFRIRYMEAGEGSTVISLHGGGGLRLSRTHDLLADSYRVIALECPGFGTSEANERSQSLEELAGTLHQAVAALGIERFNLMGNSFGGKLALWMAASNAEPLDSLILVAPAAVRREGGTPPAALQPEERQKVMHAHPERHPAPAPVDPGIEAKQLALTRRLAGGPRDEAMEAKLAEMQVPTVVLLGTKDPIVPPEVAPIYTGMMPNSHVIMIYDAAHAIDDDRPEAVSALINDFIIRHEHFLVSDRDSLIHP
ncbi:MAG: alpha/beta hydrolase [Proteobacteria bacterium]|nr:alpha/beta hydrolase [Pseudomonadota bacterium]